MKIIDYGAVDIRFSWMALILIHAFIDVLPSTFYDKNVIVD